MRPVRKDPAKQKELLSVVNAQLLRFAREFPDAVDMGISIEDLMRSPAVVRTDFTPMEVRSVLMQNSRTIEVFRNKLGWCARLHPSAVPPRAKEAPTAAAGAPAGAASGASWLRNSSAAQAAAAAAGTAGAAAGASAGAPRTPTAITGARPAAAPRTPTAIPGAAAGAALQRRVATSLPSSAAPERRTVAQWAREQDSRFKDMVPLPKGWIRAISKSTKQDYYVNQRTGQSQFEEPEGPAPGPADVEEFSPALKKVQRANVYRFYISPAFESEPFYTDPLNIPKILHQP